MNLVDWVKREAGQRGVVAKEVALAKGRAARAHEVDRAAMVEKA